MADQQSIIPFAPRKPALNPTIEAAIDATIDRLARTRFDSDPLVDQLYSRVASVVGSAYKRHGAIIQLAVRYALKDAGLFVADEPRFHVSKAADDLSRDDEAIEASLPYGSSSRFVQVDLMVVKVGDILGAYEIKRGFGHHDAGKIRSMLRDLRCVRMLLRSYGEKILDVEALGVDARLISYYGKRDLPDEWTLDRNALDAHFGAPVLEAVELANSYFSDRLGAVLEVLE